MDLKLLKALISKNLVKIETEIDSPVKVKILDTNRYNIEDRQFLITEIIEEEFDVNFKVKSTIDGQPTTINYQTITHLDGMTPERLAAAYYMNPDGTQMIK